MRRVAPAPPTESRRRGPLRLLARGVRRVFWPLTFAVVLCGVLFLGVFPTRTYIEKKQEVAAAEARLESLKQANERNQAQADALKTDAEIERIAREQYGLAKPGEESYRVLPVPQEPAQIPDVWPFQRLDKHLGP